MARLKGLKETKRKVSQTINLEDLLGVSLTGRPGLRASIAQAVIDHVVDRTEDGKDVRGNDFSSYASSYIDSAEFELAGKSPSDVNLTLSGNMLASVDLLSQGRNTIEYGISGDEAPKAYNHQTGDTVKKRQFIGMKMSDLKDLIMGEFGSEIKGIKRRVSEDEAEPRESQTVSELLNILDTLDDGPEVDDSSVFFSNVGDILNGSEV